MNSTLCSYAGLIRFLMPIQKYPKSIIQVIRALLLSGVVALLGCSPRLPANWQKDIPGVYVGNQSGFQEMIEFKSDGTFTHEVLHNGSSIHSESGKWRVPPGEHKLILEPFTEFFNRMTGAFSTNGVKYAFCHFWPLPDGKSFNMITGSVDNEFRLVRGVSGSVRNSP